MKKFERLLVRQLDQRDCGVACLLSILRFFGGDDSLDNIRRKSGTHLTGTTLLGLFQAAKSYGLAPQGYNATLEALAEHKSPLIIHVTLEGNRQHFMVFWGETTIRRGKRQFIIGDPATGMLMYDDDMLEKIWLSKTCLAFSPDTANINKIKYQSPRKWLFSLLKPDFQHLLVASLIGILVALLNLSFAILTQKLIDNILPSKNFLSLYLGISIAFLLMVAKELLSNIRQQVLIRQSRLFNQRLIGFFWRKLMHLSIDFFESRKIGELTARLHDTSRIQRVLNTIFGNSVVEILVVIVLLGGIAYYSFEIVAICLLLLVSIALTVRYFVKKIRISQQEVMANFAITESNYISTIQGIDAIKGNSKEILFTTLWGVK